MVSVRSSRSQHLLSVGALAFILALAAAGCAHDADVKESAAGPGGVAGRGAPVEVAANTPRSATCAVDTDCGSRQLCLSTKCVDITKDLPECSMVRVHFDFDQAEIHADDRPLLRRIARCLKADVALHVSIEGNADERGTEEYDLALGDRRATSVAKYLEDLQVAPAQLHAVTYGKEKPLCVAHDEDCWSKNRRTSVKPQ